MTYDIENEYAHLQEYPWTDMNSKLHGLYIKYSKILKDYQFFSSHDDYELPYLIAASKNYEKAPCRVMVIAQETMAWGGEFSHHCNYSPISPWEFEVKDYETILRNLKYPEDILQALMILYDERVNKEWGLGGFLWDFYVNLRSELEKTAPYKFGLIHNNIAKIANKSGNEINGIRSIHPLNEILIEMIKKEISITNPDIIVCCTGNDLHYQKLLSSLNNKIGDIVKTLSSSNVVTALYKVKICNKTRKLICCYHPRKLNFEKGGLTITTNKIISMLHKAYKTSLIP